jgi:predicted helicase
MWDEYPNKWQRQDLGTDLVFRDSEGLIWAVQAKCYGEHRTTTKGDMNSFSADTGRKEVNRRLWLQTTNKIEAKAEKTLKGQDKPTTVFMLNDFRDAQILLACIPLVHREHKLLRERRSACGEPWR